MPAVLIDHDHKFGELADEGRPDDALLDVLARHARLISPSTDVWLCSRAFGRWGGFYHRAANAVVLEAHGWNRPWMLRAMAHELMHAVFANLPPGHIDVLRSTVGAGNCWGDSYFDDVEERVCRLFESWVMSMFDGGMMHVKLVTGLTVQTVLDEVYAGRWAYPPPPPPPPLRGVRKVLAWL